MSECSHDCSICASKASGACSKPESFLVPANARSRIKKVVAVMSGKGGVGKSLVTSLLAVDAANRGLKVGILDADVTGPSIPSSFGIAESAVSDGECIIPCRSQGGIDVISLNLLIENPRDPVVWRGPVIAGVVKQFWGEVAWGEKDVLFVDMPPGTGDVPLTVFQSLPVDCAVAVATPQDLVSVIVEKALRMARKMEIPVAGIVENMSYFKCPGCGMEHRLFGDGNIEDMAFSYGVKAVARLPVMTEASKAVDAGTVETVDASALDKVLDAALATSRPGAKDKDAEGDGK